MTLVSEAPAELNADFQPLSPDVVRLWRITSALTWAFLLAVAAAAILIFELSFLWLIPMVVVAAIWVYRVPPFRHSHFAFRVSGVDLRVRSGWLWRSASVVMHSRIQHVDTQQGPLERMLGLSTVIIYTAGTVGAMLAIPGLRANDAESIRDRLAALSGADDGV